MVSESLDWVALGIAILTSSGILINRDWRWRLGFMALQYLSVFWLVQAHWPVSMAAAKLVTGWMACAVIGIAQRSADRDKDQDVETSWPQGRLVQFFSAGMVLAVTFALAGKVTTWLGINLPIAWGSLVLIGLGLLQLGITSNPFRVILSLLSLLAGFEILYATVESSILVTALLAVVNLGLALAGAYFLSMVREEVN